MIHSFRQLLNLNRIYLKLECGSQLAGVNGLLSALSAQLGWPSLGCRFLPLYSVVASAFHFEQTWVLPS